MTFVNHAFPKHFLWLSLFFLSCNFTSTWPKSPVFKTNFHKVTSDIRKFIAPQEITLSGYEIKTNGQTTSELATILLNIENPPLSENQYLELGSRIAKLLKSELKNPKQYNTYKVTFIFQGTKGGV